MCLFKNEVTGGRGLDEGPCLWEGFLQNMVMVAFYDVFLKSLVICILSVALFVLVNYSGAIPGKI